MKIQLFVLFAVSALIAASVSFGQEPEAELARFRDAFIKNFPRIGLNSTPGDAMFLRIMIESAQLKRGVEVGTATGYGAIVMGLAFEKNGGQLTTIDIDSQMVATARDNVAKMKLEKTVQVVEGDALEVLPKLDGEYDFVYIDALKQDYLKYFQAIEPRLPAGAVIVADNVIRSAAAMQDFPAIHRRQPQIPQHHHPRFRLEKRRDAGDLQGRVS